ncbi:MAG: hypothetical protein KGN78_08720 [Actinomycetales bacterium]|nr:hypothetical protein [Actinomycetales bacterium]
MLRACWNCHWAGLPRRKVCPRCIGIHWLDLHSATGVVTAGTRVLRNFGVDLGAGEHLVTVQLSLGGTVIARTSMDADLAIGTCVTVNSSLRASRV